MSMMNNYRKGWALRYLREAKAELTAAQKTSYIAPSLVFEAIRKAQAAIYYSLGDPDLIEAIVQQVTKTKKLIRDPILRFLVEVDRMVRQVEQPSKTKNEKMIEQVNDLVQLVSEVVELFTGENA